MSDLRIEMTSEGQAVQMATDMIGLLKGRKWMVCMSVVKDDDEVEVRRVSWQFPLDCLEKAQQALLLNLERERQALEAKAAAVEPEPLPRALLDTVLDQAGFDSVAPVADNVESTTEMAETLLDDNLEEDDS